MLILAFPPYHNGPKPDCPLNVSYISQKTIHMTLTNSPSDPSLTVGTKDVEQLTVE